MKGGVATLFTWSLQADARSTPPHIVRGVFALFVLLSVSAAYADAGSTVGPGLRFFRVICWLNVALIAVAGVSYFVSAVSEEKDAGTLALLRLAGAPPLGVVLSKSTSRLISATVLLAIQMPFTFLAVTLGGVTWDQVVAAYLALAAWLCLVGNVALLCSVVSTSSGRAAALSTGLLVLFFVSDPLLASVPRVATASGLPAQVNEVADLLRTWQQTLSVLPRLDEILAPAGPGSLPGRQFWWSFAAGGVSFLVSVLLFYRFARPETASAVTRSRTVRRLAVGRAWHIAITWKDLLFFTGGVLALLARGMMYLLILGGFVLFDSLRIGSSMWLLSDDTAWYCFLTLVGVITVESLFYATGVLMHEFESGTSGTLKLLPVGAVSVLLQKLLACVLALLPGLVSLVVLLLLNGRPIADRMSPTMPIWYAFEVLLCLHLTLLLSMRMRWAALPIALFLTAASNLCTPLIFLSLTTMSSAVARLNGIELGGLAVTIINLMWGWMFVLLPLEVEIVSTWNRTAAK